MRLATLATVLLISCPSAAALGAFLPAATVAADLPLLEPVEADASVLVVADLDAERAPVPRLPRIDGELHAPAIGSDVTPPRIATGSNGTLIRTQSASAPLARALPADAPAPLAPEAPRAPAPLPNEALAPRVLSRATTSTPDDRPDARAADAPRPPPAPEAAGWSAPLAAGAFLMVLAPMALYHHLRGAAVAEQATRRRIRDLLHARPGLSLFEIARPLGIDPTTARYHLARLVREGLVAAEGGRRQVRFFTADSVAPAERARVAAERRHERLLAAVARAPGAEKSRLRAELAISRASLDARLRKLARDGLVRLERDGRSVRVFPISF